MAEERRFDPGRHIVNLGRGKGEYLEVKWRLVWLRSEHPEASIETDDITITQDLAVFRAKVQIPGAGSATGYGSESPKDFRDYIEKAETKAIGRALAALGYGTQFAGDELDELPRIVDGPVMLREGEEGLPRAYPPPRGTDPRPLTDVPGRHNAHVAARATVQARGNPDDRAPEALVARARALANQTGLEDEELRAWIAELGYDAADLADLTTAQCAALINKLLERQRARS